MDLSKIVKKQIFEKIVCKDLKREKTFNVESSGRHLESSEGRPDDISKNFRPNFEKSKIKFFL